MAMTFATLQFTTPPEHQGQMVTISYAVDADNDLLVERTSRPDGEDTYRTADLTDDSMADVVVEPWNGAPRVPGNMWTDVE
jgi:hypothetical protein